MMVDPALFFDQLTARGIGMFTGVPDSLLKSLCAYIDDHGESVRHIITANEGNAVALAAGFHLGTGKVAAVYMQNSGLGNALNPLASLCDPQVYSIPMLLIIGWRGEPGVKDEPQHVKQGRITPAQLETAEIPYRILTAEGDADSLLDDLFKIMDDKQTPVALLVRKDTFSEYKSIRKKVSAESLTREAALSVLLDLGRPDDLLVSTTGKTSRELFELRKKRGEAPIDFLTVGSMGHTSSIALGVALGNPDRRVICLDGDGSMIMHMGALPIIGSLAPTNLIHVVINNGAHESVGGQATVARSIDFALLAQACGYRHYLSADSAEEIADAFNEENLLEGPVLFEIQVKTGSRADLGRPSSTPIENKVSFMRHAGSRS